MVLSQFFNVLFGLVIGKIIALKFSPESFGSYNLEFGFITFFFTLVLSPFIQYCKLNYRQYSSRIGFDHFIKLGLILLICALVLFNVTFRLFNNEVPFWVTFIFSTLFLFFNLINSLTLDYLNLNHNQNEYFNLTLLKSLLSLLILILLAYFYNIWDEVLVLWIIQILGLIMGVFYLNELFKDVKYKRKKLALSTFAKHYFKYSWPLMILAFWNWISSYFDRFLLNYFLTERAVGLYNANISLGSKFFLLIYPFFLLKLTPDIYNLISFDEIKSRIVMYVRVYTLVGFLLLILLFLFRNIIGEVFLSSQYSKYFSLIFWSGVGFFISTLTYFYESIFYLKKELKFILYSTIIGAFVSILFNVIFIPAFSVNGAAFSFVLASISKLIYIKLKFEKI